MKQEILEELGITKVGTYEVPKKGKDKETMTNGNGHYESKIVVEKELTNYLDGGWEFVANLNHKSIL